MGMCLAVPGRVTRVWDHDGTPMAEVDFGGSVKEVCVEYVPDVAVDEYVVVHLGLALERLDEQSAGEMLADLRRLGLAGGTRTDADPAR